MSTEIISANRSAVADGLPAERRGWAAAAIFTALAMASLDTAIANIALPAIAADLHVGPADVIWVVNVYQIALWQRYCRLPRLAKSSVTTGFISEAFCCSHWRHWPARAPGHCPAC